ncbi:MAG: amidohydrolase family protein [Candidatus Doudnabacteria bacterium]|nr:amidohydrolase family protein [Candidatus Doudnabacteria bacterium]MCA9387716.1 amidohydrolase family protein [Candidatus Andersenbacteria bacterium]
MFDLILKGGIVVDGTGNERVRADVGVTRGLIAAVGDLTGRRAERVIDVSGQFVVPGFVDVLNHADGYLTLFTRPGCDSLVRQGITTIIGGNCGTSLAPLGSRSVSKIVRRWSSLFGDDVTLPPSTAYEHFLGVRKWTELDGVNIDWFTMRDFLKAVKKLDVVPSFGTLVGFGTLRRSVVGDASRAATEDEILLLKEQLRDALRDGAMGLSLGLNFAHEVSESRETLVALARVVQEEGKVLSVHVRDEKDALMDSVEEALELAVASGVPLLISHLKAVGVRSAEVYPAVLDRIAQAQADGVDVNVTVYPYSASYSVLHQYLPDWAYEGGRETMLLRFKEPAERERLIAQLNTSSEWYGGLVVARTMKLQSSVIGRTVGDIASQRDVTVGEAVVQILEGNGGFVMCFDPSISEERVHDTLQHPLSLVASEGGSYTEEDVSEIGYLPHPRSFGAFPRFFAEAVRENSLLSWEEAIQKCCSLPALKMGLRDRGFVSRGLRADLVVFSPEKIRDRATLQNPFQYPEGIDYVLIEGGVVVGDVASVE